MKFQPLQFLGLGIASTALILGSANCLFNSQANAGTKPMDSKPMTDKPMTDKPMMDNKPGMMENNSMGKPLSQELQGKPVVVDIYATWCPGCKNIAPTLSTLKQRYQGKVNFVVLDVTNRNTTQASEAKAKQLGLASFLADNKTQTSTVAIVDPATGKVLKQFRNNPNQTDYVAILDAELARMMKMKK